MFLDEAFLLTKLKLMFHWKLVNRAESKASSIETESMLSRYVAYSP